MKKVSKFVFLCAAACFFLSACQPGDTSIPPTDSLEISSASETSWQKTPTKEQVMRIFTNEKAGSSRVITDCVVAEDMAYGLTGVVQYTDENGNACCLAFVKDTWSYPVGLGAENLCVVADDSVLTYQGNGIVTLSLQDLREDAVYDYTVAYSCSGADTSFRVSSSPRK